jgi:chemotaxis response regulator CheB
MPQPPDFERDQSQSDPVSGHQPLGVPKRMGAGVIAIGASAGGVEALQAVVAGLPVDLPAVVLVVLHIPRQAPSALPGILDRAGPLPAVAARHGISARPGTIYVAPADHHLLIRDGHLELSVGPTETATGRRSIRCFAPPRWRSGPARSELCCQAPGMMAPPG